MHTLVYRRTQTAVRAWLYSTTLHCFGARHRFAFTSYGGTAPHFNVHYLAYHSLRPLPRLSAPFFPCPLPVHRPICCSRVMSVWVSVC